MSPSLIKHALATLEPVPAVDDFNASLSKRYSFKTVGGPFEGMNPATVLRETDPLVWQMELNAFCKRNGLVKIGANYYDSLDAIDCAADVMDRLGEWIARLRNEQTKENFEKIAVQIANIQSEKEEIRNLIDL